MKKLLLKTLISLSLVILSVTCLSGQTNRIWWVDTAGNNTNAGTFNAPLRTLQYAIDNAGDKDTVILKPGKYADNIWFDGGKSVVVASQYLLTYDSSYIHNTSIEGSNSNNGAYLAFMQDLAGMSVPTGPVRYSVVGVTIQNVARKLFVVNNATLRKVTIRNNNAGSNDGTFGSFNNCTIDSCIISDNGISVQYNTSINLINSRLTNSIVRNNRNSMPPLFTVQSLSNVENCKFYENGMTVGGNTVATLLDVNSAGKNRIINNDFAKNSGTAVRMSFYSDSVWLVNNNFFGNEYGIINQASSTNSKAFIYNNIIVGNKSDNIRIFTSVSPKPLMVLKNNIIGYNFRGVDSITNISSVNTTGSQNNYGFYPGYRDTSNNDFRLSGNSLAIGKGTMELAAAYDLLGKTRPLPAGSNPDIGPYEDSLSSTKPITTITSVRSGNKRDTVSWFYQPDTTAISVFKLYRRSNTNSYALIADSVSRWNTTYIDSVALQNNTTYYYKMMAVDTAGIAGDSSNEKTGTPFNTSPKADKSSINNEFVNIGRISEKVVSLTSGNSFDADGTIDSTAWFVNGIRAAMGKTTQIKLRQGTNTVSYVVYDNDGSTDTAVCTKTFFASAAETNTSINTGLSAFNNNNIFYADVSNNTNRIIRRDSLLQLNNTGGPSSLGVNNPIISSPSVTPDSIMFIPNGVSLDAYTVTGYSWFSFPASLGGNVQVLPTIDTVLKRVYLGIDNGTWTAIDYSTNIPVRKWSYYSELQVAGFSSPGIITADRKLVYTTISGNVIGFDLSVTSNNPTPKWTYALGQNVTKAMAIDGAGNVIVVDDMGYLHKLRLDSSGSVIEVWNKKPGGSNFNTSAVIDAYSDYYIGTNDGKMIKLNGATGDIVWVYSSSSAITATPALSAYGSIYFGNQNGEVYALKTETGERDWYFKLDVTSPISSHLLHIDGATYFSTGTTKKIYQIFDRAGDAAVVPLTSQVVSQPLFSNVSASANQNDALDPVWSGYQGNFRRTGQAKSAGSTFTFTGSGDWKNSSNWENSITPPYKVPSGYKIIINPSGSGECIIDQPIILSQGTTLEVKPGKKLILMK